MTPDLTAVLAELREETGWLAEGESTYVPHHWNLHHHEQPRPIQSPDAYGGGPDLSVWCTQLDLPAAQQRKRVAQWVQALPSLQGVRRLWFTSRVSQDLLDAACQIKGLEDLSIKSSGIDSLQALAGLGGLLRLRLGPSPSVSSLKPLAGLSSLQWLYLAGVAKVTDLEPLATLSGLQGLGLSGSESKPLVADSLAPLAALQQLRWLHLASLRVAPSQPDPLVPLEALTGLGYLGLPNFFTPEQFARLSARLPRTRGDWLSPYARQRPGNFRCGKCRERGTVFTSGARMRSLCPACDSEELAQHVLRYRAAQQAANTPALRL
jgi:hypothetical protein